MSRFVVGSPCIGICQIDTNRICTGCHRSLGEIGRWSIANNEEKRSILSQVQIRRFNALRAAMATDSGSSHSSSSH